MIIKWGDTKMNIREVRRTDLSKLQELYLNLHERETIPVTDEINKLWENIVIDDNYHIIIGEIGNNIIASVTLVVIKNLTRNARPYALIENVVTHKDYRKMGYGKTLMEKALDIARRKSCYKVMLLTGAKDEAVFKFYEKCGFNSLDKTAFIKWMWEEDEIT